MRPPLCEWYKAAKDQQGADGTGAHRQEVDVTTYFAPVVHWLALFEHLRTSMQDWNVIVLADQGLYAKLGWHPYLRITAGGKYRPEGECFSALGGGSTTRGLRLVWQRGVFQEYPIEMYPPGTARRTAYRSLADRDRSVPRAGRCVLVCPPRLDREWLHGHQARRLAMATRPDH
jgi:hypothetical protein